MNDLFLVCLVFPGSSLPSLNELTRLTRLLRSRRGKYLIKVVALSARADAITPPPLGSPLRRHRGGRGGRRLNLMSVRIRGDHKRLAVIE